MANASSSMIMFQSFAFLNHTLINSTNLEREPNQEMLNKQKYAQRIE